MPSGVYKRKHKRCALCYDTHYAKGLCRNHYMKEWIKRAGENYTKKRTDYARRMRKMFPERYKSIESMHKKRFGGLREAVIQRDEQKCVECDMTRQEHKNRWGRDLTVNHIDGNGRYSLEQNNDDSNLETLCLVCHSRKDIQRTQPWLYRK